MSSSSGGTRAAGGPPDGEVVAPDPDVLVGGAALVWGAPLVEGAVGAPDGGAVVLPEPEPAARGTVEGVDLFSSQGAETRLDPEDFLGVVVVGAPWLDECDPEDAVPAPDDVAPPVAVPGAGRLVPVPGVCVVLGAGEPDVAGGVEVGVAVTGPISWATIRNRSCAVACSDLSSCGSGLPGISTTMMLPPWVLTSDSAMPAPLTLALMMSAASFSLSLATVAPPLPAACRTIRCPP